MEISVRDISKEFKVNQNINTKNRLKKLFAKNDYDIITAVDNISFDIAKGDVVGFLGPNGAGKSTTIKMLTGIIRPDRGKISINGYNPFFNRVENSKRIGVVFGQRSQLLWDLSIEDTLQLHKKMYKIDDKTYKDNVFLFNEILKIDTFSKQQVRQLSLGQKMRANLAVALLHNPDVVYLDEPTIGLDVLAKDSIRKFIRKINKEKLVTVILTTHDMNDVEAVCNRIIMIDHGRILYDGALSEFKNQYNKENYVTIDFVHENIKVQDRRIILYKENGTTKTYKLDSTITVAEAITIITREYDVRDIKIHEQGVEEIVKRIYTMR